MLFGGLNMEQSDLMEILIVFIVTMCLVLLKFLSFVPAEVFIHD